MEDVLAGLRAAAEPTRLRLLALCAEQELTVTELTIILGQSQPRVSRHLKVLCDGGLLERGREGASVFYKLRRDAGKLPEKLVGLIPLGHPIPLRDGSRLAEIKGERAKRAAAYFEANAPRWDKIRGLHVPEQEVETALLDLAARPGKVIRAMLDIGTGTGRMLDVFAPYVERGTGIDLSRGMLSVARANLERSARRNCTIRQADMYAMPFSAGQFDLVMLHQVLHFSERPGEVLAEAVRVLAPQGQIVIVDFAPHGLEFLREQHAHRRLGFGGAEFREWGRGLGMAFQPAARLPSDKLTVEIWSGVKPALPEPIAIKRPEFAYGEAQS